LKQQGYIEREEVRSTQVPVIKIVRARVVGKMTGYLFAVIGEGI
jgi:hypothetical protein